MLTQQEKNYIVYKANMDVFSKSASSSLLRGHPLADRMFGNIKQIAGDTAGDIKQLAGDAHAGLNSFHPHAATGAGILAGAAGLYGLHRAISGAKQKTNWLKYAPHVAIGAGGLLAAKTIGGMFSNNNNQQGPYGY